MYNTLYAAPMREDGSEIIVLTKDKLHSKTVEVITERAVDEDNDVTAQMIDPEDLEDLGGGYSIELGPDGHRGAFEIRLKTPEAFPPHIFQAIVKRMVDAYNGEECLIPKDTLHLTNA